MTTTELYMRGWTLVTDRNGSPMFVREGFVLYFNGPDTTGTVWLHRSTWGLRASLHPDAKSASARVDRWLHDEAIIADRARPYSVRFSDEPDVDDEPTTTVPAPPADDDSTLDGCLLDLEEAVILARRAQDRVDLLVQRSRAAGSSWTDIGDCLGISRQGARQKYAQTPAQTSPQKETLL